MAQGGGGGGGGGTSTPPWALWIMRYSMCKREYPELHKGTSTSQSTPYSTE